MITNSIGYTETYGVIILLVNTFALLFSISAGIRAGKADHVFNKWLWLVIIAFAMGNVLAFTRMAWTMVLDPVTGLSTVAVKAVYADRLSMLFAAFGLNEYFKKRK